jgi:tryptophanyl-tRNA synthetase
LSKQRILSGFRPTGKLHLGHLVGALENWVGLQDEYDCYWMVADWHAITTAYQDLPDLRELSRDMVAEWLAAGLDPERAVIFVQSQVPEHLELYTLFGMFTPIARLERNPTYKEMIEQMPEKDLLTYGFLGYPVLQAADILAYKAHKVPVGEDQVPHVEFSREVARKFKFYFKKDLFPEPEPLLTPSPRLLGLDNRKMSKSYGNVINLTDSEEETLAKVSTMITDPAKVRRGDPGHPEICNVFSYHQIFSAPEQVKEIEANCRSGSLGCVDCKKELATRINERLGDYRREYQEVQRDPDRVTDVIQQGVKAARSMAGAVVAEMKEAVGIGA